MPLPRRAAAERLFKGWPLLVHQCLVEAGMKKLRVSRLKSAARYRGRELAWRHQPISRVEPSLTHLAGSGCQPSPSEITRTGWRQLVESAAAVETRSASEKWCAGVRRDLFAKAAKFVHLGHDREALSGVIPLEGQDHKITGGRLLKIGASNTGRLTDARTCGRAQ